MTEARPMVKNLQADCVRVFVTGYLSGNLIFIEMRSGVEEDVIVILKFISSHRLYLLIVLRTIFNSRGLIKDWLGARLEIKFQVVYGYLFDW